MNSHDFEIILNYYIQNFGKIGLFLLNRQGKNAFGIYNNAAAAKSDILRYFDNYEFYFVLNSFEKAVGNCLVFGCNTVTDKEIIHRDFLFVDIDNNDANAELLAKNLREILPYTFFGFSGHGYHFLIRISDINEQDVAMFYGLMDVLSKITSVKIDTKVRNLARICRLYGTINRKDAKNPIRSHLIDYQNRLLDSNALKQLLKSFKDHYLGYLYLQLAPIAIQGQFGDNTTYQVAAVLTHDLGYSIEKTFELMSQHWNQRNQPPWSDDELLLKIRNSHKYAKNKVGSLLENLGDDDENKQLSQCEKILEICANFSIWRDECNNFYLKNKDINILLNSEEFDETISYLYYENNNKFCNMANINRVKLYLLGKARNIIDSIPQYKRYIRYGLHENNLYLQISSKKVIEIATNTINILSSNDNIYMYFPRGALDIPEPIFADGFIGLDKLHKILNLSKENFILLVAWMVGAVHPCIPYPILVLLGEQGSSKSTLSKFIKKILDPHAAEILCLPHKLEDIYIQANSMHVLAYDNISKIDEELSDAFCRISTGNADIRRQLYTANTPNILSARNPIIMNGINDFVTRTDLRDRSVFLELLPLDDSKKKSLTELQQEISDAWPYIIGDLLKIVQKGWQNKDKKYTIPQVHRMIEWLHWIKACEEALPFSYDEFINIMQQNKQALETEYITNNPILCALQEVLDNLKTIEISAKDLYQSVQNITPVSMSLVAFGKFIVQHAPMIRRMGYDLQKYRKANGVYFRVVNKQFIPWEVENE